MTGLPVPTVFAPDLGLPAPPSGLVYSLSGHYRKSRERLLYARRSWGQTPHARVLAWMRDHVHPSIPERYYQAVLGHPLHLSVWADLYARQYHADQPDPFTGVLGWFEDLGRVSRQKVTTAFRDFECSNLVTDVTTYGDFKYHEVGLSAAAELNTQTALTTTTGIARVAGAQSNPTAPTYQTSATIVADTTETWQEHGVFNALGGGVMLDRSLIGPVIMVVPGDSIQFIYVLTKAAEA